MESTKGGCFCGKVRYEFSGSDYPIANCHCSMCRKTSGAPFVAWAVVPNSAFTYTAGTPTTLNSSESGTRYFCNACGTPIACTNNEHPDIIDVTVGSLDHPENFPPTMEVFEDSRLPCITERSN